MKGCILSRERNHPLFIRPLERRVMLDAAFADTVDPETDATLDGGTFADSVNNGTGKDVAVGDFNGDGFDDLLVLSEGSGDGESILIYGSADRGDWGDLTEADLDNTNSVKFVGSSTVKQLGVEFIGDINNDGYEDIAFLNPGEAAGEGVRVVLGSANPAATIDLTDTSQGNVFYLEGSFTETEFGASVAGAGDINNDGFDDLIIGSPKGGGTNDPGRGYVLFGHGGAFADRNFSVNPLDGSDGFVIQGHVVGASGYRLGTAVAGVGDFNADGIDDLAISTILKNNNRGAVFVVFGRDTPFAASMNIIDLDASTGIIIDGGTANTYDIESFGSRITSAGDFNGDGFADIAISSYQSDVEKFQIRDAVHVIYGGNALPASFSIADIDGSNGTMLYTSDNAAGFGNSISAGADIDGDGFDDLVIGSHKNKDGSNSIGGAFVVYGNNRGNAVLHVTGGTTTNTDASEFIYSSSTNLDAKYLGESVAIGNFDGDGYADIVIADNEQNGDDGLVYYYYGLKGNTAPTVTAVADQAINDGESTNALAFTVADADGDAMTVTATSSNTAVVPDANIVIAGTGANRTVTVTAANNQSGTATITLKITDDRGSSVYETFDVTVTDVNADPTISAIANQTINEDGNTGALAFTVADADGDTVSVTGASSDTGLIPNGNIVIAGTGANRTVTVTPAAGQSGTATITLTLSDGNGGSATETFDVTVNAAAAPPIVPPPEAPAEAPPDVSDDIIELTGQKRQTVEAIESAEDDAASDEGGVNGAPLSGQDNTSQGAFSMAVTDMNADNFNTAYYGHNFSALGYKKAVTPSVNPVHSAFGTHDAQSIDIVTSVEQAMFGLDSDDVDAYTRYWSKLYDADNAQGSAGDANPPDIEPAAGSQDSGLGAGQSDQGAADAGNDKEAHLLNDITAGENFTTKLAMHANEFEQSVERLISSL